MRKRLFVGITIVVLTVAAWITIRHAIDNTDRIPMAELRLAGYASASNQVKLAVYVFTNPGPAGVDFDAHTEGDGTIRFLTNGTLASHSGIQFQIPRSNSATRLVVNCGVHRPMRDLRDEMYGALGLKTRARSFEYSLLSDGLN